MTPPTVLGLDLASRTGWAVATPLRVQAFGYWDIAPRRGESPGMRYIRLRGNLVEVHRAHPDLRLLAYEQAHQRGGAATEYAAGCVATVQAWCAELGIEHVAVHSGTLKRDATGAGNAKKPEMIAAARRIPGLELVPLSDDEADAIHLTQYALRVVLQQAMPSIQSLLTHEKRNLVKTPATPEKESV